MPLIRAIKGRRSIRRFTQDDVPLEDVLKILRAATWAPSAGNQQMWHFLVIKNREVLEKMRQAYLQVTEEIVSWPEAKGKEATLRPHPSHATLFADAPVLIAVLSKPYVNLLDSDVLPQHGLSWEDVYHLRGDPGRQSVGAAIQNLHLMAHALGYGTCWMCGPLRANPLFSKILNIRSPWRLVALVPIGVPAEHPSARPRKPLGEVYTVIE